MVFLLFCAIAFSASQTEHIADLYATYGADLHYAVREQNDTFLSFKCPAEFPHLFGASGYRVAEGEEAGEILQIAVDIDQIAQFQLHTANDDFNLTTWDVTWLYRGDPDAIHDRGWSGKQINSVFQKDHISNFFASCARAVDCSDNWTKMPGSSTVCTPEDRGCYYACDDHSYFCPSGATEHGPNIGVVVCDPRNGEWTLGMEYMEQACMCQKMENLCQTPGFKGEDYDQTETEKKFSEYGYNIVSGCNDGKVYVSSSQLIDDVIQNPTVYDPTSGDSNCTMTCGDIYEIENDCKFTTFTCSESSQTDHKWDKTIWEWTPNDCVPKCSYKTHHYNTDDDTANKIVGIVGIVFGSLAICACCFLGFYCWRQKNMRSPEAYAPLNR